MARIIGVETFCTEDVALVRVRTEDGHEGWGQAARPTTPISPRWSCTVRSLLTFWAGTTAIFPRWASW